MMRQYELVERVSSYNPNADEALLNKAYVYSMQKHGSQKRASGDPYFLHPLEVAGILTDLRLDDGTIAVGLLHDTIEDTDATRDEIDKLFGAEIGKLVEGLTKISQLDLISKRTKQAENLRKLLLAISDDVRVLIVKLADRLHNMRTLHFVPEHKRARIAQETIDIYAPLAERMGMQDIREELEGLSFKYVNPEAYDAITERLDEVRKRNKTLIEEIEGELQKTFAEKGLNAVVTGREKRAYSIFRKMQRQSIGFEQLSDIFGFRVLVDDIETCYQALGVVHTIWPSVPGKFKDYISTPKPNDYRSIHTTVIGPGRQRVELQIRTRQMHQFAEYGVAAHALYKDVSGKTKGGRSLGRLAKDSNAYAWLRQTVELLSSGDNAEEFLEHTKLELFQDQVFCFTPKGRLIALPRSAIPIDFAYAVHTGIGNTCVGCKINGAIMPLVTELANGDEVEIICSKAQTPPAAWESIVATGKARAAIRRATRDAVRAQYAGLGEQIVRNAFKRAQQEYSEERLKLALPRLSHPTIDDAFAAVGRGELPSRAVIEAVFPDYQDQRVAQSEGERGEGWFGLKHATAMKFRVPGSGARKRAEKKADKNGKSSIPIRGLAGNLPVSFAPEGGAVPGDRIVGIMTPGKGVTIYPIHSPALSQFDDSPDSWLDVRWDIDEENTERFPARIEVSVINEPGGLAEIAAVIAENDGNVENIRMEQQVSDFSEMVIDLSVWNINHLNRIIEQIRSKRSVSKAWRVN
ncbi:RelA/SpoT family protein [Cohaesibacter celericrescens]|uniref:GTP pyrophosphokinase rsh n=1 Tax=Cohaesibacter celericrescens TaxID=2067669 RepID=A0A2N5XQM0_9HYPH|nr:bifunctional (p)ppGpp synthetase/guanosine-3',5'-bis(diphosphate) 3'-pyrophosphohydrolase [Cohaesibacter celericrescens]PLW76737.1 bifunctional (p)ppGpp synthetase/guanosine-3',5'-bis(diphosphate) 3'-pyrophosphohydrolase [Cohaesibacter celericrescens]